MRILKNWEKFNENFIDDATPELLKKIKSYNDKVTPEYLNKIKTDLTKPDKTLIDQVKKICLEEEFNLSIITQVATLWAKNGNINSYVDLLKMFVENPYSTYEQIVEIWRKKGKLSNELLSDLIKKFPDISNKDIEGIGFRAGKDSFFTNTLD